MTKFLYFFLAGVICFGSSCDKNNDDIIPNVWVDFSINLTLPSYNNLQFVGHWVYLSGGSNGIVVYHFSEGEYVAFDRHCTFDVGSYQRIKVDEETNISAIDEDGCGSEFSIIDGAVLNGPASRPLKAYNTSYNPGTNVLRVWNN